MGRPGGPWKVCETWVMCSSCDACWVSLAATNAGELGVSIRPNSAAQGFRDFQEVVLCLFEPPLFHLPEDQVDGPQATVPARELGDRGKDRFPAAPYHPRSE